MPTFLVIKKIRKKEDGKTTVTCNECGGRYKFGTFSVRIEPNRVTVEREYNLCEDHLIAYANSYKFISQKYFERLKKIHEQNKQIPKSKIP